MLTDIRERTRTGAAARIAHRPEVDGLRALAVLPVILFHAGVSWLPGGFLGVDVFFVISGYLISRILLADLGTGRFSLLKFYERRARRILPALFAVIAATFALAWWLMPPDSFRIYLGSLWATALFGSNVYFWQSNGYFQPSAELQPLLHTWSLAVEEQFYVFFPLVLAALHRWARKFLLPALAVLAGLSFIACVWQVDRSPDAAFYLIHTRAWELFAGALLAAWELRGKDAGAGQRVAPSAYAQAASALGLLLIVAGFFVTSGADAVPGWKTLLPVLGTVLVLGFATAGTWAAVLLRHKALVACGLISYSAYLWHHPLFAFARLYGMDSPPLWVMLALALLSLVLAAITWRLVEQPWRKPGMGSRNLVFASAATGMLVIASVGALGQAGGLAEGRFRKEQLASIYPPLSTAEDCDWQHPVPGMDDIAFCHFGAPGVEHPLILWGDSHARALKDALDEPLKARLRSAIYVSGESCIRTPGIYRKARNMDKRAAKCEAEQQALFAELRKLHPSQIVVSMRWTLQTFPVPGAGPTVGYDNGEGGIETETARTMLARNASGEWTAEPEGKARAIKGLISSLADIAPVTVLGPVPEVGWNVGDSNFKAMHLHGAPPPELNTSYERFLARNSFILGVLEEVGKSGVARLVWPHLKLCNSPISGRCVAQYQGTAYYADDDHLSRQGANLLLPDILPPG